MSTYSANSSTNYSHSKQSPEYGEDEANQTKAPPMLKRRIHKHYEPLVDNNVVYRYEEDPVEYKKARK